jgi:hypothetical protein
LIPPETKLPVVGSIGSIPDKKSMPFASIAWLYCPIASGALFVVITFLSIVIRYQYSRIAGYSFHVDQELAHHRIIKPFFFASQPHKSSRPLQQIR